MDEFLSKSRYCSGLTCGKQLWLNIHKPEEKDLSRVKTASMERGTLVGDLARGLFGKYTLVDFDKGLLSMISQTDALLEAGTRVICEASFSWEGNFCSVDLLLNHGGKHVEIYEVKSAAGMKDYYIDDLSYQCLVLSSLGYIIERACVVHLNNQYVRHGELDLQQLFTVEDLTEQVLGMRDAVRTNICMIREYLKKGEQEEPFREACKECAFWPYCSKDLPSPNVFDLAGCAWNKKLDLFSQGLVCYPDLLEKGKLKGKALSIVQCAVNNENKIDRDAIGEFLAEVAYPLYYLDFETFMPAVPLFDDTKPYQQIPFQYSLHWQQEEGGKLYHAEFLAYPGDDPRRALAEQLCADIPENACVMAYNMSFERTRIAEMAALFPDLSEHLMNIHDHIIDLMVPFQGYHCYLPSMQGSYSIKYVLPALCPNDPELDYHQLEGVHNGAEASETFEKMSEMSPNELETSRRNLLKYCGLDTLAMVKVLEKLRLCYELHQ